MKIFTWLVPVLACATRSALVAAAGSSFGGVNHYYIANLPSNQRDDIITKLNNAGVRVLRTFVGARPYDSEKRNAITTSPDFENPLGQFDLTVLRRYDDLLAAVYRISGGRMKVLLSLHNGNNLGKASNDPYCDVYCQNLHSRGLDWHQFYNDTSLQQALRKRYLQALTAYQSPNFNQRTWNSLSEVILAVNLENEPMVGDNNIDFNFGTWVCDLSRYLKNDCRLNRIAVASGGLRGADYNDKPPAVQGQNWTPDVFTCDALDIISLHGYYKTGNTDQPWYDLLIQKQWGGILRQKALDNKKLIMVEEWSYSRDPDDGFAHQNGDIWAQSHALNVRGIPWIYWDIRSGPDGYCDDDGCKEVSVDGQSGSPWSVLASQMTEAYNSATEFDWSPWFPVNKNAQFLAVPQNGQTVSGGGDGGSSCNWGCVGWQCSSSSPCQGDNECVSGTCKACSWGCKGWQCSASSPCKGENECVNGVCKACSWGCKGWACSASSPCKDANECVSGTCKACSWGCKGWSCDAKTPCQGQLECNKGVCSDCTWGCRGWNCNSQTPCKSVNQCGSNAVCKPCEWGCPGWSCSSSSPCQGDLECKSATCSACTWGCLGWACSTSSPCKGQNECVNGSCKPCSWGCLGWSCSASSPCKASYKCVNGACRTS